MENISSSFKELLKNSKSNVTLLANASAFIMDNFNYLNWVGFYLYDNDETLLLGPFQGKVACEEIKVGSGVCGTSFLKNKVLNVSDVNNFKGHIVCDNNSKSELVIPLVKGDIKIGVLDIDSYLYNRFDEKTIEILLSLVSELVNNYRF